MVRQPPHDSSSQSFGGRSVLSFEASAGFLFKTLFQAQAPDHTRGCLYLANSAMCVGTALRVRGAFHLPAL